MENKTVNWGVYQSELEKMAGRVGFYYKNLSIKEEYGYCAGESFQSASVIKLPVFLQILRWAEAGKADLTEVIRIKERDKVPVCGALTLFTGEPEADVLTLCKLMISISDNTASNVLFTHYGIESFQKAFKELGLKGTHLRRIFFEKDPLKKELVNDFSPQEIGSLLEELFEGRLLAARFRELAMDTLLQQQINHKMGGFLGEEVPIAHKTGENGKTTNDVGIILAKEPIVLCFAGEETDPVVFEHFIRKTSYELYLKAEGLANL